MIKRYRIFFLIGLTIFVIQLFLAYKSFRLDFGNATDDSLQKVPHNNNIHEKQQHEAIQKSPQKVLQLVSDDEDNGNSNIFNKVSKEVDQRKPHGTSTFLHGLNFEPSCDISAVRETVSAVQRAKTQLCKKHIIEVACGIQSGEFYPVQLPNSCPNGNYIANRSLGCYKDEKKSRLLPGYYTNFKESNSPKKCIKMCLQSGFLFAGVQYS